MIWSSLQLTSKQWIFTQQFTAGADLFLKQYPYGVKNIVTKIETDISPARMRRLNWTELDTNCPHMHEELFSRVNVYEKAYWLMRKHIVLYYSMYQISPWQQSSNANLTLSITKMCIFTVKNVVLDSFFFILKNRLGCQCAAAARTILVLITYAPNEVGAQNIKMDLTWYPHCWHFNIYEQDKFHAQLSWAWKSFIQLPQCQVTNPDNGISRAYAQMRQVAFSYELVQIVYEVRIQILWL